MSASNVSGGVRNLRAMFENKGGDQSTSPPSRGRSPSNSVASTNSRPVSKVRASFVAVERSGEQGQLWGLRKASDVSSMAEVKENETSVLDGPPLTATQSTPERDNNGGLGHILKGSSFAATPMKEKPNAMESTRRSEQLAQKQAAADDHPRTNGVGARAAEAAKRMQDKAKSNPAKANPAPIETKHTATTKTEKPSPRTPTSAGIKPRGGVAKIKGVIDSAREAAEGREATKKAEATKPKTIPKSPAKINGHKAEDVKSPRSHSTATKLPSAATTPTAASWAHTHKDPEPVQQSPRAATKPSKLPSAAMAPTAASAAHIQKDPEPTKKKSTHSGRPAKLPAAVTATTAASAAHDRSVPDPHTKKPASRRPSAVHSSHARLSTASTQSSLHKKASRASLAERPKSRSSLSKPDEGFLARMMRPTQSSQQKTHEKTLVTSPPRAKAAPPKPKGSSRPSLVGDQEQHGHGAHHTHHDHVDPAGDYATKSPTSPTASKHSAPKAKAKAALEPRANDSNHSRRTHHDHVDPAGDYAQSTTIEATAPETGPAPTANDAADPNVVEEAPMTVEDAEAPVKDESAEPAAAPAAKSEEPAIEIKPDESSKSDSPAVAANNENQPVSTDITAPASETKDDAVVA